MQKRPGHQTVPHDPELEQGLLGALLFDRNAVTDVLAVIGADDFHTPGNGEVFNAILGLYASGSGVDLLTVADALSRSGELAAVGGKEYLNSLSGACPMPANATQYAQQLAELSALRRLMSAMSTGHAAALERRPSRDVAEQILHNTYDAVSRYERRGGVQTVAEVTAEILNEINCGTPPRTTPTGFANLDNILGGLRPGAMITLAARPAVGKSSLALCMAYQVAATGRAVVFSSLEMSAIQLGERLLSLVSGVPGEVIQSRQLNTPQRALVEDAMAQVAELPLVIDDGATNLLELRARAQKSAMVYGELGLIVIDYLQLLSPSRSNDNRSVEVGELSRGLKLLSVDFSAPVLALSQLSRQVEYRGNKRPVLSDLRDSGCMPATTRILRADTGEMITLGELVVTGERPLVWSMDANMKMSARQLTNAFATGVRPVFRLTLASGRSVEATGNHRFRTLAGWRALEDLALGDLLAVAYGYPNPDCRWGVPDDMPMSGDGLVPRGITSPGQIPDGVPMDDLCAADVSWDEVVGVEYLRQDQTFDATVEGTHNFIAEGIVAHNSIEQDSDAVMFIYRPEGTTAAPGVDSELIVSKNRHGALGTVGLNFNPSTTKFTEALTF